MSLLLGLLLSATPAAATRSAQPHLQVGDAFPDLARYPLEGELPEALSGRVVVVDFWASWCGRCKGSFELLETLQKRLAPRGVIVLSINVDESRAAMDAFLKEHPVTFSVLRDKTKALVRDLNIPSMPTFLVVGPDGRVRSMHGSFPTLESRTRCFEEVEGLLKKARSS